jgi:hypothetical protein
VTNLNRRYLTQKERAGYWNRVALEREASKILRADRRRQRPPTPAPRPAKPEPKRNGWIKLEDLRRVMRRKNGE